MDTESSLPARPSRRGQKQQIRSEKASELVDWETYEAPDPSAAVEIVVRGKSISADGGSAEVIGLALQRIGKFLDALGGSEAYIEQMYFGNSVHLLFRSPQREIDRANADRQRARDVRDERGPNDDVAQQLLRGSVSDVHVAASLAADLVEAIPTEAPAQAAALGTEVAQSFKSLSTAVARNGLEVEVVAPDRPESVRFGAAKAERVAAQLRTIAEPEEVEITVVGRLSIADAIQHGYGLRLDPDAPRPAIIGNRRVLRGRYTPAAEDAIIQNGLWGRDVRARILVEQDAVVSTSTVRPPTFTLASVEAAY